MTKKKEAVKKEAPLTRNEIRDAMLGHTPKAEVRRVTVFGIDMDLKQASLGEILDAEATDNVKISSVNLIIRYACVPGTNEKLFDDADRTMIENWPFNKDVLQLQEAIAELTGIDIEAMEQELLGDPLDKPQ